MITKMELLKNLRSVRINSYKEFFHLYGFMLLSGSIVSDNHNGAIEKFERRSDKEIFALVWLHDLKW